MPGSAKAFLGHRSHGLAYRNYVDPLIARPMTPQPPAIDDDLEDIRRKKPR
jgi:hypothetical protein